MTVISYQNIFWLNVAVNESGALPVWREFMVVPANVYESLIADTQWLESSPLRNLISVSGTTITVLAKDGTTTQYTRTGTFTPGADVLTGLS